MEQKEQEEQTSEDTPHLESIIESEANTTPEMVDIDKFFPKGQYPVCYSCHESIRQLQFLTNIDGKPIHKSCKAQIEAQKKQPQDNTKSDKGKVS